MRISEIMTALDAVNPSLNNPQNYLVLKSTGENIASVIGVLTALKAAKIVVEQDTLDDMVRSHMHAYIVGPCVKSLNDAGILTRDNFNAIVCANKDGNEVVRSLIALNVAKILTEENRKSVVDSKHAHELAGGLDLLNRPRLLDQSRFSVLVTAGKDAYGVAQGIIRSMDPLALAAVMRARLAGITGDTETDGPAPTRLP